jgi:hypothetical protein
VFTSSIVRIGSLAANAARTALSASGDAGCAITALFSKVKANTPNVIKRMFLP